jgi:hypothetical protein
MSFMHITEFRTPDNVAVRQVGNDWLLGYRGQARRPPRNAGPARAASADGARASMKPVSA